MCVKGQFVRRIVEVQRDQEVPVHEASEESEGASGMGELGVERQPEITGDDGAETALHDQARDILVPDVHSGDHVVLDIDSERQPEIIGDDSSDTALHDPARDPPVPNIDSGDQVVPEHLGDPGNLEESNLICNENIDYDAEFPEDNLAGQVTKLENGADGAGAESSAQVANDPVVSNLQSESPGQGDGEDLIGDIPDEKPMDELLREHTQTKLDINVPPW